VPAAIAILLSTSCGQNRYLNQWSNLVMDSTGLSAASRKLAKTFWFAGNTAEPASSSSSNNGSNVA
jgi:hypothetical protein